MSNFYNDLTKAKKYEHLVGERFESNGWNVTYAPDRYFPDYDLQVEKDGIIANVEIKVDYMSCKTGNIAVEYCKADRKTKAGVTAGNMNDYIFYLLPDKEEQTFRCFLLKKHQLYKIAKENKKFEAISPDQNGYCFILPLTFIENIKPCNLQMQQAA